MTRIRFEKADGTPDCETEADAGANLLDVAQANGQPLEGACEKNVSCSTCHVIVAPADFGRFGPMSEEEDDLLDLALGVSRTSRLACQCTIPDGDPVTVRMPGGSVDWSHK